MTEGNWQLSDQYYEYNGAGNTGSRIYMGSFIFMNYPRAKDPWVS